MTLVSLVKEPPELDSTVLSDLYSNWRAADRWNYRSNYEFISHLESLGYDSPDVTWCYGCSSPALTDDVHYVDAAADYFCEPCYDELPYCSGCDETVRETHYLTGVGVNRCDGCRDQHYSYCDDCSEYYHDDDAHEHDHVEGCDCEAPGQHFHVRNDGDPLLGNDQRATVALPSGVIDQQGIDKIKRLIRYAADGSIYNAVYVIDQLDSRWQTRDGNYTKRLSRAAYNEYQVKIPADVLSQVGCIARDHSGTTAEFHVEFTRDLNQSADDFYHEDSCWWGGYYESRCALKSNGGLGLRTFSQADKGGSYYYGGSVTGRAWVLPLRQGAVDLVPTFDTLNADAFVVFNGYGDLSGYAPARIVAHMTGMTYRKITFDADPMYVNDSKGYLIAREEIAGRFTDGSLNLSLSQHSNLYSRELRDVSHVS